MRASRCSPKKARNWRQSTPLPEGKYKITDIKGRTIHPDGTVIPLTVKPEDLMVVKSGDIQIQKRVFTLPSVEVGSILEYRYDFRYDDDVIHRRSGRSSGSILSIRRITSSRLLSHFMPDGTPDTATSRYLIDEYGRTVNSLIWWNRLPPGVKMQTSVNGSYSVDVTDIPATPDEEYMPPIESILYRVFFYYKAASDPGTSGPKRASSGRRMWINLPNPRRKSAMR